MKWYTQVGHLHAGCTKDFTVTVKADSPCKLEEAVIPARLSRITFDKPVNEVSDWDDRLRCVKWVDATEKTSKPASANSGK